MKTFKQYFESEGVAGNEHEFFVFFVNQIGQEFPHVGVIKSVSLPGTDIKITDPNQELPFTRDTFPNAPAIYKSDILINDLGVSLKQERGSNVLNWVTSTQAQKMFPKSYTTLSNYAYSVAQLQASVQVSPSAISIDESEWERMVTWAAFKGTIDGKSENIFKLSPQPASIVVVGPRSNITRDNIAIYDEDTYFEKNKDSLAILFRRVLVGGESSKHPGKESSNSKIGRRTTNEDWKFKDLDWVKNPKLIDKRQAGVTPLPGVETYVAVNLMLRSKK